MGNSLKAVNKKEEYCCCYCVQPTCIAPQGSQRETLSRFPGISLLFVITAYSRKKRSSRSVVLQMQLIINSVYQVLLLKLCQQLLSKTQSAVHSLAVQCLGQVVSSGTVRVDRNKHIYKIKKTKIKRQKRVTGMKFESYQSN